MFKKDNHPLAIMIVFCFVLFCYQRIILQVESKRLNLLRHPVVGSLLHRKWLKFGQYGYFVNLLTYCLFLTSLTVFALIVENPMSPVCEFTSPRGNYS